VKYSKAIFGVLSVVVLSLAPLTPAAAAGPAPWMAGHAFGHFGVGAALAHTFFGLATLPLAIIAVAAAAGESQDPGYGPQGEYSGPPAAYYGPPAGYYGPPAGTYAPRSSYYPPVPRYYPPRFAYYPSAPRYYPPRPRYDAAPTGYYGARPGYYAPSGYQASRRSGYYHYPR
jgi:hypothetical protein